MSKRKSKRISVEINGSDRDVITMKEIFKNKNYKRNIDP